MAHTTRLAFITLALLVSAVAFAGCTDGGLAEDPATATEVDTYGALPMSMLDRDELLLSQAELKSIRDVRYQAVFNVYEKSGSFYNPKVSLEERDAAARRAIELAALEAPDVQWIVDQSASTAMLTEWLAQPSVDPERIELYVSRLIERKNPNTDIVRDGLDAIGDSWAPERMAEARAAAAEAGLSYLERSGCDDCRTPETQEALSKAGLDNRRLEIAQATRDLAGR